MFKHFAKVHALTVLQIETMSAAESLFNAIIYL